jgi:hypothetical protein
VTLLAKSSLNRALSDVIVVSRFEHNVQFDAGTAIPWSAQVQKPVPAIPHFSLVYPAHSLPVTSPPLSMGALLHQDFAFMLSQASSLLHEEHRVLGTRI